MMDRLGSLMKSSARVIRRDDLPRTLLEPYGIAADEPFAVLHTGARIVFSRWPHYLELAARLHADTALKIVLFTGDPNLRAGLPADVRDSDRFVVLDRQLPFDEFDAAQRFASALTAQFEAEDGEHPAATVARVEEPMTGVVVGEI